MRRVRKGMTKKQKDTIIDEKTRLSLQFNNVWAILVSVFIIAMSWMNLQKQLALLTQKVDFQTQLLQEHKEKGEKDIGNIIASLNEAHRRLAILEGINGVKNNDASATLK